MKNLKTTDSSKPKTKLKSNAEKFENVRKVKRKT